MRIQNNIMAMNTHRMYTTNNSAVSKSAEKLSSGYRINRAGDDAAGLAISEKMRAQVRGLNMASKNSQDAISLVQTAEGALQEVHSMLQRMNELAVQSATGTNADFDRTQISAEFEQLKEEIDQIAETTDFNNMKLLDGSVAATGQIEFTEKTAAGVAAYATIDLTNANLTQGAGFKVGEWTYRLNLLGKDGAVDATAENTKLAASKILYIDVAQANQDMKDSTKVAALATSIATAITGKATATNNFKASTVDAEGGTTGTKTFIKVEQNITNATDPVVTSDTVKTFEGGLQIQVGAEQGNTLFIAIEAMNSKALKLSNEKIDSQAKAGNAITATRKAVDTVSNQRSILGAMQNRLEHKISNLDNTSENLSAAESRIRDCDLAKEMTNYTKNNILSQAATAMLAQANSAPQNVLSLLQ